MDSVVTASTSVSFDQEPEGKEFSLSLSTGDTELDHIVVKLVPVVAADIEVDAGSISGGDVKYEKMDESMVEWSGTTYGLAEGDVDVTISLFKSFKGSPGGFTVDLDNLKITSKKPFDGLVKIKKKQEYKEYKWKPSNYNEIQSANVYASYKGRSGIGDEYKFAIAITQVSWTPKEMDRREDKGDFSISLSTGEKTKTGVYVNLTPAVAANIGSIGGSISGGAVITEDGEPEYVVWNGSEYGLSEGDVNVRASVYKVFEGSGGKLTVDEDELKITSEKPFVGLVRLSKDNQYKRYLWKPDNPDQEDNGVVYASYDGRSGSKKKIEVSEGVFEDQLTTSVATTQVSWPSAEDNYPIQLSVGRQDNEEGCVYIYQTPNTNAVKRGTDIGSISDVSIVQNKTKDIYTVWSGNSISLPDGCVSCTVSVYKVYDGSSGGITVDLAESVATSKEPWNGIVKLTTVTESKKLKWEPPNIDERTLAVVHAYRKGTVSMVNVEWKPNDADYDIRIELGTKGSNEGSDIPLKEIKLRMYPANDEIVIGCTEGSLRRGQNIIEDKTQYLEFQLVPLPDISGTNEVAWEPNDPIDASDVSKVSLGKGLLSVEFEIVECFNRFGVSVEPSVYYDLDSGNAVGNSSFYGLVKATYKEEYKELLYQQAYSIGASGIMSVLTGYVYGRLGEKAAFCEVPWDTNMPNDKKDLYWVYSYYVASNKGTFEYPDNWLNELKGEIKDLDKKTYTDWETLLESRGIGKFAVDDNVEINPSNCSIEKRVHRTVSYNFIGKVYVDNSQPIRGTYYKPYENVKAEPTSSYKPKYFLKFAGEPEVYDSMDEFGEDDYSMGAEFTGKEPLFIPNNDSKEQLKKAWKSVYARFDQAKIYQNLQTEFPGLIRIPAEPKE